MNRHLVKTLFAAASAFALAACGGQEAEETAAPADTAQADVQETPAVEAPEAVSEPSAEERLDAVLAGQSDEAKARYQYRNPKETLTFFRIEPGMTVVDTLPGAVWYSGILSEYLGPDGKVVGADYPQEIWPLFGSFATPELIESKKTWVETWVAEREAERKEGGAPFAAFQMAALPAEMEGTADVMIMVRAIHNMHRFESEGGFLTQALADASAVLKPGGYLGIIQHRGPEGNSDEWASGGNGYLKQSRVIALVEGAGFELVEASEINANPNDQPTEEDFVWRLPPRLAGSEDNEERRAEMTAIGESDRMTLLFRKPA